MNRSVLPAALVVLEAACAAHPRLPDADAALIESERRLQYEEAASLVLEHQKRLLRVGSSILVSNAPFCERQPGRFLGVIAANRSDLRRWYGDRDFWKDFQEAFARRYEVGDSVKVLYVIPGSPADQAGLQSGDIVLAMGPILDAPNSDDPEVPYEVVLVRDGQRRHTTVPFVAQCGYTINLLVSDEMGAVTNGTVINISTAMLRFASTDNDLANILGHELAHNILPHLRRKVAQPSKGTRLRNEREADYLAVYFAARAGYDVSGAATFWRRWAIQSPLMISDRYSDSHPGTAERVVRLERAIAEVLEKQQRNVPLIPEGLADIIAR